MQTRFQAPWCSTVGGVLSCDGSALGCADWLGPLVTAVACEPKRLQANLAKDGQTKTGSLRMTVEGRTPNPAGRPTTSARTDGGAPMPPLEERILRIER